MTLKRSPSRGEDIASSITHGIGFAASLLALPVLVVVAAARNDPWQIAGGTIFGITLVLLYGASTVYHALPPSSAKRVFRALDQSAIYLLIAGTYSPFTLGVLRGPWGWSLFGTVWALAGGGIVVTSLLGERFPHVSTALYLFMGWLVIVAIRPLMAHVSPVGLGLLAAGGLSYTIGVAFYLWERLRYGHVVWHLFVAAGSACHFFAALWHAGRPPA
jgi:hemolysin III